MTTTVVVGQELHTVVREFIEDSTAVVGLADETGMIPAAWCIGSGRGATAIRRAVRDRVTHLVDGDRGYLDTVDGARYLTVRVSSNASLPPVLAQYVPLTIPHDPAPVDGDVALRLEARSGSHVSSRNHTTLTQLPDQFHQHTRIIGQSALGRYAVWAHALAEAAIVNIANADKSLDPLSMFPAGMSKR